MLSVGTSQATQEALMGLAQGGLYVPQGNICTVTVRMPWKVWRLLPALPRMQGWRIPRGGVSKIKLALGLVLHAKQGNFRESLLLRLFALHARPGTYLPELVHPCARFVVQEHSSQLTE